MREKMNVKLPRDVSELYTLADKCARAEEGQRLPREDASREVDSEDDDAATPKGKGRKRKGRTVMAIEGSGDAGKKVKEGNPGKDVAGCADCRDATVGEKASKTDGPYCKIHRTKGHDLQECLTVEQLAEKQRAKYKRRDQEKGQEGAGGPGKKNHSGLGARRDNPKQQKEKPMRGRDRKGDDDNDAEEDDSESSEQEFQ
jgi:hypothetical protein